MHDRFDGYAASAERASRDCSSISRILAVPDRSGRHGIDPNTRRGELICEIDDQLCQTCLGSAIVNPPRRRRGQQRCDEDHGTPGPGRELRNQLSRQQRRPDEIDVENMPPGLGREIRNRSRKVVEAHIAHKDVHRLDTCRKRCDRFGILQVDGVGSNPRRPPSVVPGEGIAQATESVDIDVNGVHECPLSHVGVNECTADQPARPSHNHRTTREAIPRRPWIDELPGDRRVQLADRSASHSQ